MSRSFRIDSVMPLLVVILCSTVAEAQEPSTWVVARSDISYREADKLRVFAKKGDILTLVSKDNRRWVVENNVGSKAQVGNTNVVEMKDAAPIYTELIRANPRDHNNYVLRSQVWAVRGDEAMAIADCDRAIQLKQDDASLYVNRAVFLASSRQYDRAIADYGKALEMGAEPKVVYTNRAAAYVAHKDFDGANHDYTKLIALFSKDTEYYVRRGVVYRNQEEWDKAIADFSKVIEIDPSHSVAISSRGYVQYLKGDHANAVKDFTRLIELDPKSAQAYNNRGYNRHMSGEYASALADYNQSIQLDSSYAMAYQNKAWLLATCPEDQFRNGQQAYAAAIESIQLRSAPVVSDYKAVAAAYAEIGDFNHAVEYQQKVIDMTEGEARQAEQAIRDLYMAKKPLRSKSAAG